MKEGEGVTSVTKEVAVVTTSTQTERFEPKQYQQMVDQLNNRTTQLKTYKEENSYLAIKNLEQTAAYNKLYENYSKLQKESQLQSSENRELKAKVTESLAKIRTNADMINGKDKLIKNLEKANADERVNIKNLENSINYFSNVNMRLKNELKVLKDNLEDNEDDEEQESTGSFDHAFGVDVQIASLKSDMREYQEQLYFKIEEVKNTIVGNVQVDNNKDDENTSIDTSRNVSDTSVQSGNAHKEKPESAAEFVNPSDKSNKENENENCCCCDTFVRGMSHIKQQISNLNEAVNEKSLHSTILEEQTSPMVKAPTATGKKYKWEDHSSGAARKVVNKMGYGGKGLGKNENGIEDALTADSVGGNLSNKKKPDTIVFSSSILKGVNTNGFNKGYKGKTAKFFKFHGRTAAEIKAYIPVNVEEERPDNVVIAASGNGVPTGPKLSVPLQKIVDDVIQSGKLCKDKGVKQVYISSFLPRRSLHYQSRRMELNKLLRDQCKSNGFVFMANSNIEMEHHLADDGVHLNSDGSSIICKNLLYHLNKGK